MSRFIPTCILSFAVMLAACEAPQTRSVGAPILKQATVNGVTLRYIEQGQGVPVVFVHGAISDHRTWEAQREPTATRYRYIALDQRYFGPAPWPDDGRQFSVAAHASDLAAFVRQLRAGPVHLVGWSSGANVVLVTAVQHPELVRSLFLYEPSMSTFVTAPGDRAAVDEDAKKRFSGGIAAAQAKDNDAAVRALLDGVDGVPGTYEAYPKGPRDVTHENARTLPLAFAAPPPPSITCAQLGEIKAPTAIVRGELTPPFFRVIADTAARCIPGSRLIVEPRTRHLWPTQNPAAFNRTLLEFLAKQ
jgi:pimeloyl-ACP methyl ester carboxylesterase